MSLSVGHPPPRDLLLNYVDLVMLHRLLMHLSCHTVSPHLWIVFVKKFQKVSVDMTTNPTYRPLLALFVQTPLCLRLSLLDLDSVSCAWLVTILLEAALHQVLQVLS